MHSSNDSEIPEIDPSLPDGATDDSHELPIEEDSGEGATPLQDEIPQADGQDQSLLEVEPDPQDDEDAQEGEISADDKDKAQTGSKKGEPSLGRFTESMRILEAILFASEEPLTNARLKQLVPGDPDARALRKMVDELNTRLQRERHPFEIVEVAGGYQFRTISYYSSSVRQLLKEKAVKKLSIQALECLAIIAYKQPITKAEIEGIRGVVSDGAMKTLLERRVVTIAGRSDKPGRPLLYATTKEFLTYFGLKKLSDLPRIDEIEALAKEKFGDLESEFAQMKAETAAESEAQAQDGSSDIPVAAEIIRDQMELASDGSADEADVSEIIEERLNIEPDDLDQ